MSNGSVDFQKSKAMPPRIEKDLVIAIVLAMLPILLVAALIVTGNGRDQEAGAIAPVESSALSDGSSLAKEPASIVELPAVAFDYEAAAELSALRWQAMAEFYETNGLLTRAAPQFNADLDRFTVAPNAEQAREYEALRSERGAVPAADDYAYYTERYWKLAEELPPARTVVEPEYDFYTERYWKLAEELPLARTVAEPEYDFYTQRYWEMAGSSHPTHAPGEVEQDYASLGHWVPLPK